MKYQKMVSYLLIIVMLFAHLNSAAGLFTSTADGIGNFFMKHFGPGTAGQTAQQVSTRVAKHISNYGDGVVPYLKRTGHGGVEALEAVGEKAPDLVKYYVKNEGACVWMVSRPRRLAIFVQHGETAADAMFKHSDIAEDLIERFGSDAASALNVIARPNGQRLKMLADDGLLSASARSPELLPVIRQYGDEAMEFIWKNKSALAGSAVLISFLNNPQAYISGAMVLAQPILAAFQPVLTGAGFLGLSYLVFYIYQRRKNQGKLKNLPVEKDT